MRSLVLLALVSTSSVAAPSFSTESAGTLGRPDLASPSRIQSLVQLDARRVVAVDAAGLARLWDVSDWQQLGVASPGTRVTLGPCGLALPGEPSGGCLLAAPLAATRDGRLLSVEGLALRLCDPTGREPPRDIHGARRRRHHRAGQRPFDGTAVFRATAEGDVELIPFDGGQMTRFHAEDARVVALQPTSDGRLLTAVQDGIVRGVDRQRRKLPARRDPRPRAPVRRDAPCAEPSRGRRAGAGVDGHRRRGVRRRAQLRLAPAHRAAHRARPLGDSAGPGDGALFAADGTVLVAAAGQVRDRVDPISTTLVRLDPRNGAPAVLPPGHRAQVTALRFSPTARDSPRVTPPGSGRCGTWARGRSGCPATTPPERWWTSASPRALETLLSQHEDDSVRTWRVSDGAAGPVLVPPPAPDPARSSAGVRVGPGAGRRADAPGGQLRARRARPLGVVRPADGARAGALVRRRERARPGGRGILREPAPQRLLHRLQPALPPRAHRGAHRPAAADPPARPGAPRRLRAPGRRLRHPRRAAAASSSAIRTASRWPAPGNKLGKVTACEATPDGKRMLLASSKLLGFWEVGPADDARCGAADGADRWAGGASHRGVTSAWTRTGRSCGCARGRPARWRAGSRSHSRTTSRPRPPSRRTGDCWQSARRAG